MAHRVTWYKSAASHEMLDGVEKPSAVSELYRHNALNLLSYMTLAVRTIHSVLHYKDKRFTVLDYPRNFGNVA